MAVTTPAPAGAPAHTASSMIELLRRHYIPKPEQPAGVFAAEIQAPESYRRADLIWAPVVPSAGDGPVGHEVKVSRADVLVELTDPMKCEAWAQFCTRWWLVVSDPAFVEGLDIPETWGIMAPPSGRRTRSMTVIRPAPLRKVHDTGPGWKRLLSWQHHHLSMEVPRLERELHYSREKVTGLKQRVNELNYSAANSPEQQRVARIVQMLNAKASARVDWDGPLPWLHPNSDLTDEVIVDLLLDVVRSRKVADAIRREAESLLHALDAMRRATDRERRRVEHLAGIASDATDHQD